MIIYITLSHIHTHTFILCIVAIVWSAVPTTDEVFMANRKPFFYCVSKRTNEHTHSKRVMNYLPQFIRSIRRSLQRTSTAPTLSIKTHTHINRKHNRATCASISKRVGAESRA